MSPASSTSPTSHSEVERKYDVDDTVPIPDLVGIGPVVATDPAQTGRLIAVYFDTADLDLAHRAIALRRRQGGADAGWHVKLPAAEGRTELHWPLGTGSHVPDQVVDPVREFVGDRELTPIARVTNMRTTTRLCDAAGNAIAELCDDHVRTEDLVAGVSRIWREWEVELLAGAPDTEEARTILLDTIEAAVVSAGAHPSTSVSKLARALGRD